MKYILRFTLISCFLLSCFSSFGETISKPKQDSIKLLQDALKKNSDEKRILELKNEIIDLTKTVADTKESFYNSRIYLWGVIIAALALIMVVVGYLGVQSLRNKLIEIKSDVENSKKNGIETIVEIKNDVNKRIDDLKVDLKDFKQDQKDNLDKFEINATEKIKRGLDLALQDAINNIMKGTYGSVVEELQEQISNLTISLEELKSNESGSNSPMIISKAVKKTPVDNNSTNSKSSKNAFDGQSE